MKMDTVLSDTGTLRSGVPQGSILGPTLYLLYINSIRKLQLKGEYCVYADDTSLIYNSKCADDLERDMNGDLKTLSEWLSGLKLAANPKKTVYMLFKKKNRQDFTLNLQLNTVNLQRVENVRYLGVIVDEKLSWYTHIANIEKRIYPLIGAIKRSSNLTPKVAKLIYNAYILPHIRYNISIWSSCSQSLLTKLQTLMNRALKTLFRVNWFTPRQDLIQQTDTLSLSEITFLERCKTMFKLKNKLLKNNIELINNNQVHSYHTRRGNMLRYFQGNTLMQRSINYSINCFNELPNNIKYVNNVNIFSKLVIRYLKQKRTL